MSWAQSGEAENFQFNTIALNLFPLVKASKKDFSIPVRYNPELEDEKRDQKETEH